MLATRGNSEEAKSALSELCAAYYEPVFAFITRKSSEEKAKDLTQEFFSKLLTGNGLHGVDRAKGRFRSYLLGAVKHFLADAYDHSSASKRGAGQTPVSIEGTDTSTCLEVPDMRSPDIEFDRKWALALLDRALSKLAEEHKNASKLDFFETLKPWLLGESENLSQADAAAKLSMNEGAVKVAIHRLRRRFRDLVKLEISQTLNDPAQVQDELQCLMAALSKR